MVGVNRYTWSEFVDKREAQEAEFRELYDDRADKRWMVQ